MTDLILDEHRQIAMCARLLSAREKAMRRIVQATYPAEAETYDGNVVSLRPAEVPFSA